MTKSYLTPTGYGEAELVEKRSRFIARVWRVEDEAEAVSRIKEMREKHWDATHNVYAYSLLDGGIMRYSDDGEPGGTSGIPTLNVFRSEEIQNVCCVITRYFGGTLLGTGGLVRAYSAAAKLALDAAGVSRMALWDETLVSCAYNRYERVKRLLEAHGAVIGHADFGMDIRVEALISQEKTPLFTEELRELTSAAASCDIVGSTYRAVRVR